MNEHCYEAFMPKSELNVLLKRLSSRMWRTCKISETKNMQFLTDDISECAAAATTVILKKYIVVLNLLFQMSLV